jgi:hypothetical protein
MEPDSFNSDAAETTAQHSVRALASARVKVLNPLTSTDPPMRAELLSFTGSDLRCRVPRLILVGSTVQVRTGQNVAFGDVRSSVAIGSEFEIELDVRRSA